MGNTINKKSPFFKYAENNGFLLNENTNIDAFVDNLIQLGLLNADDLDYPIEILLSKDKKAIILPFKANNNIDYAKLGLWRMINRQYFVSDKVLT